MTLEVETKPKLMNERAGIGGQQHTQIVRGDP